MRPIKSHEVYITIREIYDPEHGHVLEQLVQASDGTCLVWWDKFTMLAEWSSEQEFEQAQAYINLNMNVTFITAERYRSHGISF